MDQYVLRNARIYIDKAIFIMKRVTTQLLQNYQTCPLIRAYNILINKLIKSFYTHKRYI